MQQGCEEVVQSVTLANSAVHLRADRTVLISHSAV